MKWKYHFIFLFVLFSFFTFRWEVDAAAIGTKNICSSNQGQSGNNSCNSSLLVQSQVRLKEEKEEEVIKVIDEDKRPFLAVILIDDSSSMSRVGYPDSEGDTTKKKAKTNKMFRKLVQKIKNANQDSKVYYCHFENKSWFTERNHGWKDCVEYTDQDLADRKNVLVNASGQTTIQQNLKKAYHFLNVKKTDEVIPMVALITDGLANSSETNFVIDQKPNLDDTTYIGYSATAKHAYYTMRSLRSFREKMPEAIIATFGIGMNENDVLSRYYLNPTVENYHNMANARSTETQRLYNWMKGTDSDVTDYEFVAFLTDNGIYKGTLSNNKKKVTFHINTDINSDDFFKKYWMDHPNEFSFMFPVKNTNFGKSALESVELYYMEDGVEKNKSLDIGSDGATGSAQKEIFKIRALKNCNYLNGAINYNDIEFVQFILKPDSNGNGKLDKKNKHIIKVVFNFKERQNNFRSYTLASGIPKYDEFSQVNGKDIVNYSYIGPAGKMNDFIEENVTFKETYIKKEIISEYPVNEYTPCNATDISVKAYMNVKGAFWKYENGGYVQSSNNVGEVELKIPIILVESLKLNYGSLSPGIIFAGGGFSWNGTFVESNIQWYYHKLSKSNSPMFNIEYKYYFKNSNNSLYSLDIETKSLEELNLCTDSSCNTKVTQKWLEEVIWSKVANDKLKSNVSYSGAFLSVDNNDGKVTQKVNVPINTSLSSSPSGTVYSGGSDYSTKIATYRYNISLKNAYIKNKVVSYENSAGATDGGALYYVPLNYPVSSTSGIGFVSIDLKNDFNFSLLKSGIDIKFNNSCGINVKQLFYCDGFSYNYRSIDVENPFPKNVVPENWAKWYENASNKQRLINSYSNYSSNNPLYSIKFDSNKKNTILSDDSVYTDWTGITNNGVSTFVQTYFDKLPTNDSYCKKGKWNSSCDIRR